MSEFSVQLNQQYINPIHHIEFGLFRDGLKRQTSAVSNETSGIYMPDAYDATGNPVPNGVQDGRLGTTDIYRNCGTCGLSVNECPCHHGHCDLPVPIYSYIFMEKLKDVLSCMCHHCGKLLLQEDDAEVLMIIKNTHGFERLDALKKKAKKRSSCLYCSTPTPTLKKETKDDGKIKIIAEYTTESREDGENGRVDEKRKYVSTLMGSDALRIVKKLSDSDCKIIGINSDKQRPDDLIESVLCVAPPSIRPAVRNGYLTSGSAEDDLTKESIEIIKRAGKVRKEMDKEQTERQLENIMNQIFELQYRYTVFQNNNSTNVPKSVHRNGSKATVSIAERLSGKKGRIRDNLDGKRVNWCARSVISSDSNIGIEEVTTPLKVAMTLTFPEKVTKFNIERLKKMVANGKYKYPGANSVIPYKRFSDGIDRPIDLSLGTGRFYTIRIGDIVNRHMLPTDPVMFNRQPSLHRMSIMCHMPKINMNPRCSTFGLNVNVTTPYNADFDGDEMNMTVPQNKQTQIEIRLIADVKKQIINPGNSMPVIKFKQDVPEAFYLMTAKNVTVPWRDAMLMVASLKDFDKSKIGKKDITTYKLFSFILPKSINYYNEKMRIRIINGDLIEGTITNKILSSVLIKMIWDKHDSHETTKYINNANRLGEAYLLFKGQTLGYKDSVPSNEIIRKTYRNAYETEEKALHKITKYENNPSYVDYETFENNIIATLRNVKADSGAICMESLTDENNFYTLIQSGAKGSSSNVGEIMGPKGQEFVRYKRIPKTVNGRTLPHVCFNDDTPEARGFIKCSYNQGVDPASFWFYHQGGREGLINTAIGTAETGYQQRRLTRLTDTFMIYYDGTVRSSGNIVIQLIYGDNGFDQTLQTKVEIKSMKMSNSELKSMFEFTDSELKALTKSKQASKKSSFKKSEMYEIIANLRSTLRDYQFKLDASTRELNTHFHQPVNYGSLIYDYMNSGEQFNETEVLTIDHINESIDKLLSHEYTPIFCYNSSAKVKVEDEKTHKFVLKLAVYEYLAPKRCIFEYKLTKGRFDALIQNIIAIYKKSIASPGEMVGIVSGQSVGEPLTQMTLSSFHKSGSGVVGLQGAPRVKEILAYTKEVKTPNMTIYLKPEYKTDKTLAHKVASSLRFTMFNDLVKKIETVYDPFGVRTIKDEIDVESAMIISNSQSSDSVDSMHWVMTFYTSRESLFSYDVEMIDIKTRFALFWNNKVPELSGSKDILSKISGVSILTNYENSEIPAIHVRFNFSSLDMTVLTTLRTWITKSFHLKGDPQITKIDSITETPCLSIGPDGELVNDKEYVIYTNGINFSKIRRNRFIDQNRTVCNQTETIRSLYGIDAARMQLYRELKLTFTAADVSINYSHISLICDSMTHRGHITSVDRNGISKIDTDTLSRASFEKTMNIFVNAAVFNEVDDLSSVGSRVIVGTPFKGGTGLCSVSLDTNKLETSKSTNLGSVIKTESHALSENPLMKDTIEREHTSFDIFG